MKRGSTSYNIIMREVGSVRERERERERGGRGGEVTSPLSR